MKSYFNVFICTIYSFLHTSNQQVKVTTINLQYRSKDDIRTIPYRTYEIIKFISYVRTYIKWERDNEFVKS